MDDVEREFSPYEALLATGASSVKAAYNAVRRNPGMVRLFVYQLRRMCLGGRPSVKRLKSVRAVPGRK